MLYLELFIQGLLQGSIYALIAVGLTIVYGLLRILHVAHAGLYTLGGYFGVLVFNITGSLVLGGLVAMLGVGIFGIIIYRLCYQPILDQPPYVPLIASIGLFIAMEELYRILFGSYGVTYSNPPLQDMMPVGGIYLRQGEWVTILASIVLIGGLAWLSRKTRLGLAWRATVTDAEMAESFGIDPIRVRYLNFFIGSILAGAAGMIVGILNNLVEPTMGSVPSYKALAIIVLGGLGSVRGTLVAALSLGVIESFGTIYLGEVLNRDAIAFVFLILVLMVRPKGMFRGM
tara:strand:+ start:212 stop:1072 length:861 start_codon:yes stop_codon:yes gene_type:complete